MTPTKRQIDISHAKYNDETGSIYLSFFLHGEDASNEGKRFNINRKAAEGEELPSFKEYDIDFDNLSDHFSDDYDDFFIADGE